MQQSLHRAAAKIEHVDEQPRQAQQPQLANLSWDDFRIFIRCAELSSFRKAATKLNLSSSTVVRRMERLERALGIRLFDRIPDGVMLTPDAQPILANAREMERSVCNIVRERSSSDPRLRGPVSISITEGLGSYWVMPRLIDFQRQHPLLRVSLRCAMESADVLRLEADMAVQFERPTNPNLVVVKLGRLHVHPFASQDYLNIYGMPKTPQDLLSHRLVQQAAPQLDESALARFYGLESLDNVVTIKTNASTAHFYAVEKGAGIGGLPTYAVALKAPVVPVDLGARYHLDIWLTYHPDIRRSPHKAIAIDWLRSIFDPRAFPWFRDEFIHPNDLVQMTPEVARVNFGEGFFAVEPR